LPLTKSFTQLLTPIFPNIGKPLNSSATLDDLTPTFIQCLLLSPLILPLTSDPHSHPRTEGFLTADQLIKAHGRCGKLLHAANPFGQAIDYAFYHQSFVEWHRLIIGLLNCHQVRLRNDPNMWLIQMGDFSTDDVSYNVFAPFAGNPASISDRLAAFRGG
jgi:hypothetical protein